MTTIINFNQKIIETIFVNLKVYNIYMLSVYLNQNYKIMIIVNHQIFM